MKTPEKYARRKRWISLIIFVIACLMLTLFFYRTTIWAIVVITASAILVAISLRLNRCPECNARVRNEDADKCDNCGCDLK